MYKRALMLTAATVALMSGPSFADTSITTKTDKTLQTSTSGNITITSSGGVVIPTSSTAATVPAIEINSNNNFTLQNAGALTFQGTADAIGVQADSGHTGEILIQGAVDLTGAGSDKTGIQLGTSTTSGGTFTGIVDATNNVIFPADLTALAINGGGTIEVQGDGSTAINLVSSNTVSGDIYIDGAVGAEATSLTSTSSTAPVIAVGINGTLNGNLLVDTGGAIVGLGASASGLVLGGQINGAIYNQGSISAIGTNAPGASNNPLSGAAMVISGNVTGGIYNAGPNATDSTVAAGNISSTGSLPTVLITPGFAGNTLAPIVIGGFTDPAGTFGSVSFLNRGAIVSGPANVDVSSIAFSATGSSAVDDVVLSHGIVNTGSISASAADDLNVPSGTLITATAMAINSNVNIVGGLINSDEANSGSISAKTSGPVTSAAVGINIAANSTFPSINNSGTISASATTSDPTITSISAFAIADASGTLTSITNSGTISAGATTLNNGLQIARAIQVNVANAPVTLTNTGSIFGEVLLGSFGDTVTSQGASTTNRSAMIGNINFGGGNDTLNVNSFSTVSGNMLEQLGGHVAATVQTSGVLNVTNNGSTVDGAPIVTGTLPGFEVSTLSVQDGGTLGLTLAQGFNTLNAQNSGPVVHATQSINLASGSVLNLAFGGFVSTTATSGPAKFVVFDAPSGNLIIANPATVQANIAKEIPFLFTGSVCAYAVAGFTQCAPQASNPNGANHSDLVFNLTPKSAANLGLTGFAAAMFAPANTALGVDNALGAAVITGVTDNKTAQAVYSAFAPDVTGSSRAIAISITDQATGAVGARQRALRMYAGQDADISIWGQEFTQRLSVPNKVTAGGYSNTGFGFAMGMDGGSPSSGRYGGALTFYSGDTTAKAPLNNKTTSEWYMLTGYQDWRGKGLFFDSQISAAYGHINGTRRIIIDEGTNTFQRAAQGKRASAMAAGGFTTGFIFNSGGTVLIPELAVDALTLREEGYTESNNNATTIAADGFDLKVKPYYANSLRAFAGVDLRQDLRIGDFYLQPEGRLGYRYDFVGGAEKLKAEFVCSTVTVANGGCGPTTDFSITGPDPARANLVAGGGIALTTGAWSIGLNYDYLRGMGGTKGVNQTALITLLGRI